MEKGGLKLYPQFGHNSRETEKGVRRGKLKMRNFEVNTDCIIFFGNLIQCSSGCSFERIGWVDVLE